MSPEDCTTSYNSSTRRSLVFRLRYTASLAGVPPNSRLITNKNLASMRVGEAATNNRVHKETPQSGSYDLGLDSEKSPIARYALQRTAPDVAKFYGRPCDKIFYRA